jgi:hypothetical protein
LVPQRGKQVEAPEGAHLADGRHALVVQSE